MRRNKYFAYILKLSQTNGGSIERFDVLLLDTTVLYPSDQRIRIDVEATISQPVFLAAEPMMTGMSP